MRGLLCLRHAAARTPRLARIASDIVPATAAAPACPPPAAPYNMRYNDRMEPAMKLKITRIGNSAGVILPKELLARLRLEKGDELYAIETPDGVRLTAFDPTLARQMEVAEKIMREDRLVLHKLAQ